MHTVNFTIEIEDKESQRAIVFRKTKIVPVVPNIGYTIYLGEGVFKVIGVGLQVDSQIIDIELTLLNPINENFDKFIDCYEFLKEENWEIFNDSEYGVDAELEEEEEGKYGE